MADVLPYGENAPNAPNPTGILKATKKEKTKKKRRMSRVSFSTENMIHDVPSRKSISNLDLKRLMESTKEVQTERAFPEDNDTMAMDLAGDTVEMANSTSGIPSLSSLIDCTDMMTEDLTASLTQELAPSQSPTKDSIGQMLDDDDREPDPLEQQEDVEETMDMTMATETLLAELGSSPTEDDLCGEAASSQVDGAAAEELPSSAPSLSEILDEVESSTTADLLSEMENILEGEDAQHAEGEACPDEGDAPADVGEAEENEDQSCVQADAVPSHEADVEGTPVENRASAVKHRPTRISEAFALELDTEWSKASPDTTELQGDYIARPSISATPRLSSILMCDEVLRDSFAPYSPDVEARAEKLQFDEADNEDLEPRTENLLRQLCGGYDEDGQGGVAEGIPLSVEQLVGPGEVGTLSELLSGFTEPAPAEEVKETQPATTRPEESENMDGAVDQKEDEDGESEQVADNQTCDMTLATCMFEKEEEFSLLDELDSGVECGEADRGEHTMTGFGLGGLLEQFGETTSDLVAQLGASPAGKENAAPLSVVPPVKGETMDDGSVSAEPVQQSKENDGRAAEQCTPDAQEGAVDDAKDETVNEVRPDDTLSSVRPSMDCTERFLEEIGRGPRESSVSMVGDDERTENIFQTEELTGNTRFTADLRSQFSSIKRIVNGTATERTDATSPYPVRDADEVEEDVEEERTAYAKTADLLNILGAITPSAPTDPTVEEVPFDESAGDVQEGEQQDQSECSVETLRDQHDEAASAAPAPHHMEDKTEDFLFALTGGEKDAVEHDIPPAEAVDASETAETDDAMFLLEKSTRKSEGLAAGGEDEITVDMFTQKGEMVSNNSSVFSCEGSSAEFDPTILHSTMSEVIGKAVSEARLSHAGQEMAAATAAAVGPTKPAEVPEPSPAGAGGATPAAPSDCHTRPMAVRHSLGCIQTPGRIESQAADEDSAPESVASALVKEDTEHTNAAVLVAAAALPTPSLTRTMRISAPFNSLFLPSSAYRSPTAAKRPSITSTEPVPSVPVASAPLDTEDATSAPESDARPSGVDCAEEAAALGAIVCKREAAESYTRGTKRLCERRTQLAAREKALRRKLGAHALIQCIDGTAPRDPADRHHSATVKLVADSRKHYAREGKAVFYKEHAVVEMDMAKRMRAQQEKLNNDVCALRSFARDLGATTACEAQLASFATSEGTNATLRQKVRSDAEDIMVLERIHGWQVKSMTATRSVFSFASASMELRVQLSSNTIEEAGSRWKVVESAELVDLAGDETKGEFERALVKSVSGDIDRLLAELTTSKQLKYTLRRVGALLSHASDVGFECSDIARRYQATCSSDGSVLRVSFQAGKNEKEIPVEFAVGGEFVSKYPLGPLCPTIVASSDAGNIRELASRVRSTAEAYAPPHYSYGRLLDICDALQFLVQQY